MKPDAVLMHPPRPGDGEQQQIEPLQRIRHLGQEAARFPAGLRCLAGRAVRRDKVFLDQVGFDLAGQRRLREHGGRSACSEKPGSRDRSTWGASRRIARSSPARAVVPRVEKIRRIFRSAATCSRCRDVKSLP